MGRGCCGWIPGIIWIDLCIFNTDILNLRTTFLKLICSQNSTCVEEGIYMGLESRKLEMLVINWFILLAWLEMFSFIYRKISGRCCSIRFYLCIYSLFQKHLSSVNKFQMYLLFTHLILITTLQGRYNYCSHFVDGENWSTPDFLMRPRSQGKGMLKARCELLGLLQHPSSQPLCYITF